MQIQERDPGDVAILQQHAHQAGQAQQRDRYRAALLAIQGHPTLTIQQALGRSRGFVQRWCYAYRDQGIKGLVPARRGGSQPRLKAQQVSAFIQRFTAGPTEADGGRCTLRGKDAQRILAEEFKVSYSLNGVYQLLHRHRLACLKPRPRHRKQDASAAGQWLGDAPLLSSVCVSSTTSRSKSGSRMKPASASKAR